METPNRSLKAIAKQITDPGHEAVVQDLRQKFPDLLGFDFVAVGSPTRFARANGKALGALKQLKKKKFTEKPVVIFDTYGPIPTNPEDSGKG